MIANTTPEGTMPAGYLPPEIMQYIIDNIKDDMSAMQRCSLVSHSWCLTARPYLFRNVILGRKPISVILALNQFMELCSHPHSTLHTAGIQVFGIGGIVDEECWGLNHFFLWLLSVGPGGVTDTTMASRLFWNLDQLQLNQLQGLPGFHAWSLFFTHLARVPEFCNVRVLTVTGAHLSAEADFHDLAPLRNIERLILGDVTFGVDASDRWIPSKLRQLDLSGQRARSLSFSYFSSCATLQELCVTFNWSESSDLQSFLTESAAVRSGSLQCCILKLSMRARHRRRHSLHFDRNQLEPQRVVCTTRVPEIVVEGTVSLVNEFFRWTYNQDPGVSPIPWKPKVTKIVLTDGEQVVGQKAWDNLDCVWTTHLLFRSLKEIRVEFMSLEFSYLCGLSCSEDGNKTPTPRSTRSAMMASQGNGAGLLQETLPLCSERNLLKVSKQDIKYPFSVGMSVEFDPRFM